MYTAWIFNIILSLLALYFLRLPHRNSLGIALLIAAFVPLCVSTVFQRYVPEGYEAVSIGLINEQGVIEVVEEGYYKDENGNYFWKAIGETQQNWNPIYCPLFEKVEPPIFEFDNIADSVPNA